MTAASAKRTRPALLATLALLLLTPAPGAARPSTVGALESGGNGSPGAKPPVSPSRVSAAARPKGAAGRRSEKRRIPSNTLSLTVLNTGERLEGLKLFETRGDRPGVSFVSKAARQKLQHLCRDWRTGKVHRGMPDALWYFLYLVSYHYDQPVQIISGYRSTERRTSRHRQGLAIDFRVPGVDSRELWEYAKKRFTHRGVGLGYYPNVGFVHLDIRDKSYFWIDDSGKGERAQYRDDIAQPVEQWQAANRRAARRRRRRKP